MCLHTLPLLKSGHSHSAVREHLTRALSNPEDHGYRRSDCRWHDWQSEFSSIATGPMTFGRVPDRHRRPLGRGAPTHGDREFLPYREDHTDPHSRWLVVVS